MPKIKLKCICFQNKHPCYFEVRSPSNKNGYNRMASMDSSMGWLFPLVNIEQDQTFDNALVKRLAKILEFLPNIED
jgi:hypothetical protein